MNFNNIIIISTITQLIILLYRFDKIILQKKMTNFRQFRYLKVFFYLIKYIVLNNIKSEN